MARIPAVTQVQNNSRLLLPALNFVRGQCTAHWVVWLHAVVKRAVHRSLGSMASCRCQGGSAPLLGSMASCRCQEGSTPLMGSMASCRCQEGSTPLMGSMASCRCQGAVPHSWVVWLHAVVKGQCITHG